LNKIRKAELKDLDQCLNIYLNEDFFKIYQASSTGLMNMFKEALQQEDFIFIVAHDENEVILGFAIFDSKGAFSRSGYLKLIVIDVLARGNHIGESLIHYLEENKNHKNGLFLLVTSSNEKAQKFYLKLGYEKVGELKNYVKTGIDEYIFFKPY
jgi:ribosomal protein S18 acetylase RimI-like enzyme